MYEPGTILKLITRIDGYPLFVMAIKARTAPDKFNGVILYDAAKQYAECKQPGTVIQNATAELYAVTDWDEVFKFIN